LVESVTCTAILTGVEFAVTGVPLITPPELKLRPAGNCPLVIFQASGVMPPDDTRVARYGTPPTASGKGPAGVPIINSAAERKVTFTVIL